MTPSARGAQGRCDQSGQPLTEGRFACVQDILHTARVTSQDQQFPYGLHSGLLYPLRNARGPQRGLLHGKKLLILTVTEVTECRKILSLYLFLNDNKANTC